MMNIFESLREDHDRQRQLMEQLVATEGASEDRGTLFSNLTQALADHAAAEEKHFYSKLMQHDITLEMARHSVAEHKELDDRVEELEAMDHSNPQWLIRCKELRDRVLHHLEEEEREVFQLAGKALSENQKSQLASSYRAEMAQS